jgi:hypothetical protein
MHTIPKWDHGYEFAASVGHLKSDLVGLLVYVGMRTISREKVFLCIKLLVLVTRIMPHQFFKINYLFIWHNDGATHTIL